MDVGRQTAAYVTYQLPWLGNKLLAGGRIERRGYDLAGVAEDPAGGSYFFPSLHVERVLGRGLTANLSYSSRIGWQDISDLDPRLRLSDPATGRAGNPRLRPERTHSAELKLTAKAGGHEGELTATWQKTRDLESALSAIEEGVLVTRPVNLGTRVSWGANASLRGPLAKGLRYVVTADAARDRIGGGGAALGGFDGAGFDGAGFDGAGTRYGGSLQLIYRDGTEGRAGADQLRVTARYSGPVEAGLTRVSAVLTSSATWSHALTDRLSSVLSVTDLLGAPRYRTESFGGGVATRREDRAAGPSVRLSLSYGLGAAPESPRRAGRAPSFCSQYS